METIAQLTVIKVLKVLNENLTLWLAEDTNGQEYEVLTIKPSESNQKLLDRIFRNEIAPITNQDIGGMQKIIRFDFDEGNKVHYILYENIDGFNPVDKPTLDAFKSLIAGLDYLKKQNRFGFVISDQTVMTNKHSAKLRFVGLFELFQEQNLLDKKFIALELAEKQRPNFQSDMYSAFMCFKDLSENYNDEILKGIFEKSLSHKRTDRYSKYSEVLDELEKVRIPVDISMNIGKTCIRVSAKPEDIENLLPILNEMNSSCSILLDKDKSADWNQIKGRFSTKNFSGKFNVNKDNYIFIHYNNCVASRNSMVLREGFVCEYGFDFYRSDVNCFAYFYEKWENINTISALNQSKKGLVNKWQTLPDMERQYVEESAFNAEYVEREESKTNPTNIRFRLTDEFRNWELVKELKRNEVLLTIDDKIIGQVQDYNSTNCYLIIKDARITLDEIPAKGKVLQDVRMETSQFKKQVEACKKFENNDIVNPELCAILATPERVPTRNRVNIDYENFKNEVKNQKIRTDDTQRDAVLEALHHKPVYLIQGPPGTGKTTVIIELIQQILSQNKNAKILVTSQSNLAVDNVLEQLPDQILFMRLAANEEKISNRIKEHSFQSKLKHWVEKTHKKSTNFLNLYLKDNIKDKALAGFYRFYSTSSNENGQDFASFTKLLRMQNQYIQQIFEKAKNINEVEHIFSEKLGAQFKNLSKIQADWFAFLSNAEGDVDDRKKSKLNDGSIEIDLQTAFVKSVSVIGATCIHISSSQYSKINFRFDYVIMDESSKASPAESLVPINMGQNVVLIGDHKQLPPVITREEAIMQKVKAKMDDNGLDFDKDFGESLFEKLITEFDANPNLQNNIKMLNIQYRMPRQIGNLISRFFYDGKLKNPNLDILPDFDREKHHSLKLKKATSLILDATTNREVEVPNSIIFVSTSKELNPDDNNNKYDRRNECSKNSIIEILKELNRLYPGNSAKEHPFTIGVIAGYRGQVNLLTNSIDLTQFTNFTASDENGKPYSLIEINTVDKFQGAERDIIIYDIVKSSKGSSSIGFLDDYRRINVAFSRVKRLLIIVGDSEYVLKRATLNPDGKFTEFKLRDIVAELDRQGVIVHHLNDIIS